MPLGPSSFSPVSQALNFPGGMRLPSINSFLAMSNLGGNTNSHPPSNFSRDYNSTQERFIDLTADSSSPPRPTSFSASPIPDSDFLAFLRAEESTTSQTSGESASMTQRPASGLQEPSTKRRRLDSERSSPSRHISNSLRSGRRRDYINVDSLSNEVILDLTDVEGREALHKVQEEQRERHLALQEQQNQLVKESVQAQGQDKKGPFKLGQIQCVICMDNITDMTTTICGHIFCHTCIMEALIAGENQGGNGKGLPRCPSCRTKVVRNLPKGPPQIIPLALKFTRKSEKARGKERAST